MPKATLDPILAPEGKDVYVITLLDGCVSTHHLVNKRVWDWLQGPQPDFKGKDEVEETIPTDFYDILAKQEYNEPPYMVNVSDWKNSRMILATYLAFESFTKQADLQNFLNEKGYTIKADESTQVY